MHKLSLIFKRPVDQVGFESRWSQEFVPKAEAMPGLRRVAVSRVYGSPSEDVDLMLMHEFFFDDAESLRRAMASPQGQTAGKTLMAIAADFVTICFAEHMEEDR